MKFNVGDMVHVKKWEDCSGFVTQMKPLCGKPAIITEIEDDCYKLRPMKVEDLMLDWEWYFSDDMVEV